MLLFLSSPIYLELTCFVVVKMFVCFLLQPVFRTNLFCGGEEDVVLGGDEGQPGQVLL